MRVIDLRNDRWLNNPYNRCEECGQAKLILVGIGDYEYESRVCPDCMAKVIGEIAGMRRETA